MTDPPASHQETALIAADGLACRRGGRLLFVGLDFTVARGASAVVLGPNGIGKSSLLRLCAGLLAPFEGDLRVGGTVSLCDDRLALDLDRPLRDALGFWARLDAGAARLPLALAALDLAGLGEVPVRYLSTGQRKRAVLARTIASGADIWLLDEPANGLDTASLALLDGAVRAHLGRGGAVLAASHQALPWPGSNTIQLVPARVI